jgi:hypothetical protein
VDAEIKNKKNKRRNLERILLVETQGRITVELCVLWKVLLLHLLSAVTSRRLRCARLPLLKLLQNPSSD